MAYVKLPAATHVPPTDPRHLYAPKKKVRRVSPDPADTAQVKLTMAESVRTLPHADETVVTCCPGASSSSSRSYSSTRAKCRLWRRSTSRTPAAVREGFSEPVRATIGGPLDSADLLANLIRVLKTSDRPDILLALFFTHKEWRDALVKLPPSTVVTMPSASRTAPTATSANLPVRAQHHAY